MLLGMEAARTSEKRRPRKNASLVCIASKIQEAGSFPWLVYNPLLSISRLDIIFQIYEGSKIKNLVAFGRLLTFVI